jgi:hypothetical protein
MSFRIVINSTFVMGRSSNRLYTRLVSQRRNPESKIVSSISPFFIALLLVFSVSGCAVASITHTFDMDTWIANRPGTLGIMYTMSWFGIPSSDPQGPGPDSSWGNWQMSQGCVPLNNASYCSNYGVGGASAVYSTPGFSYPTSTPQRQIASRRRPLAGIYSSSAKDNEGLARLTLQMSIIRQKCFQRGIGGNSFDAGVDAMSPQMDSIQFTSKYPTNPQCSTCEIAYSAMLGMYKVASQYGLNNVIIPGLDGTWSYNFGSYFGLSTLQAIMNNVQADIADMVTVALQYPQQSVMVNGKPLIFIYINEDFSPTNWTTMLNNARTLANSDFYALGGISNSAYFAAFDALAPWGSPTAWPTSGSSLSSMAQSWMATMHSDLINGLPSYPGRVIFSFIMPSFDDYTEDWGQCMLREMPTQTNGMRDPSIIQGQFAYIQSQGFKGIVFETWDDWTEGTCIEPDIVNGTQTLMAIKQGMDSLNNLAPDPYGDARMNLLWTSYPQQRNCLSPIVKVSDANLIYVNLRCPNGPNLTSIVQIIGGKNLWNVGATVNFSVTLTNGGNSSVELQYLVLAIRGTVPGTPSCTDDCHLCTSPMLTNISIAAGGIYQWTASSNLGAVGSYVAFVAYQYNNQWSWMDGFTVMCSTSSSRVSGAVVGFKVVNSTLSSTVQAVGGVTTWSPGATASFVVALSNLGTTSIVLQSLVLAIRGDVPGSSACTDDCHLCTTPLLNNITIAAGGIYQWIATTQITTIGSYIAFVAYEYNNQWTWMDSGEVVCSTASNRTVGETVVFSIVNPAPLSVSSSPSASVTPSNSVTSSTSITPSSDKQQLDPTSTIFCLVLVALFAGLL